MHHRRLAVLLALLVATSVVVVSCGGDEEAEPVAAEPEPELEASTEWADHTTETESYRIVVRTGPSVSLAVMEEGATMTLVDQGQAVNHHLEVHIFEKSSGAEVKNLVPAVGIEDGDSKEFAAQPHSSGEIPYVTACLLTNHRVSEPHFGDNLHLADGTYTVTVTVGNEIAAADISVKAA